MDSTLGDSRWILAEQIPKTFFLLIFIAECRLTAGVGELGQGKPDAEGPEVAVGVPHARSVGFLCVRRQRGIVACMCFWLIVVHFGVVSFRSRFTVAGDFEAAVLQ